MEVIGASAGGGGTIEMVASGSLSNGQTVIVTSDGKVTGVSSLQKILALIIYLNLVIFYILQQCDSTKSSNCLIFSNSNHGTAMLEPSVEKQFLMVLQLNFYFKCHEHFSNI